MSFVTHDRFDITWHLDRGIPYDRDEESFTFYPERIYKDEAVMHKYHVERRADKEQHVNDTWALVMLNTGSEKEMAQLFHQGEAEGHRDIEA